MARGLSSNWKQPLAYFFSNTTCKAVDLKSLLFEAILKLKTIGLSVKVVVSDMGSSNISLTNMLRVTPERPYFFIERMKLLHV